MEIRQPTQATTIKNLKYETSYRNAKLLVNHTECKLLLFLNYIISFQSENYGQLMPRLPLPLHIKREIEDEDESYENDDNWYIPDNRINRENSFVVVESDNSNIYNENNDRFIDPLNIKRPRKPRSDIGKPRTPKKDQEGYIKNLNLKKRPYFFSNV